MKWVVFIKLVCYLQIVYPKLLLHFLSICVKCTGAWGKIPPMKWEAFIVKNMYGVEYSTWIYLPYP